MNGIPYKIKVIILALITLHTYIYACVFSDREMAVADSNFEVTVDTELSILDLAAKFT